MEFLRHGEARFDENDFTVREPRRRELYTEIFIGWISASAIYTLAKVLMSVEEAALLAVAFGLFSLGLKGLIQGFLLPRTLVGRKSGEGSMPPAGKNPAPGAGTKTPWNLRFLGLSKTALTLIGILYIGAFAAIIVTAIVLIVDTVIDSGSISTDQILLLSPVLLVAVTIICFILFQYRIVHWSELEMGENLVERGGRAIRYGDDVFDEKEMKWGFLLKGPTFAVLSLFSLLLPLASYLDFLGLSGADIAFYGLFLMLSALLATFIQRKVMPYQDWVLKYNGERLLLNLAIESFKRRDPYAFEIVSISTKEIVRINKTQIKYLDFPMENLQFRHFKNGLDIHLSSTPPDFLEKLLSSIPGPWRQSGFYSLRTIAVVDSKVIRVQWRTLRETLWPGIDQSIEKLGALLPAGPPRKALAVSLHKNILLKHRMEKSRPIQPAIELNRKTTSLPVRLFFMIFKGR